MTRDPGREAMDLRRRAQLAETKATLLADALDRLRPGIGQPLRSATTISELLFVLTVWDTSGGSAVGPEEPHRE